MVLIHLHLWNFNINLDIDRYLIILSFIPFTIYLVNAIFGVLYYLNEEPLLQNIIEEYVSWHINSISRVNIILNRLWRTIDDSPKVNTKWSCHKRVTMATDVVTNILDGDYVNADMEKISDEDCLKNRKWWCFLLSSICTFLMGIFSVLFVRAIAAIFCTKVTLLCNSLV